MQHLHFDASSECQESISTSQTASSSTENGNCSDSSGDDADNDENVVRKELKSRRQWKRKSNSSAAEMLTFLQTYTEKGEKAEEEKLNLLRDMKDEKKQFFSQFLEILKKQVIEEISRRNLWLLGRSKFKFSC